MLYNGQSPTESYVRNKKNVAFYLNKLHKCKLFLNIKNKILKKMKIIFEQCFVCYIHVMSTLEPNAHKIKEVVKIKNL
ncbi:hypothetical protein PI23P_10260 [Polaribacter irgensii 23-P]|uniref:Uncharacterized protein n=1 Tax=Polaribacter irgensii 23-P TaxID=313594 RepID=A4C0R1_9FLAO|nr:hypothetical protein PI23P_10260 [Polaribacter irgensii 23-P]